MSLKVWLPLNGTLENKGVLQLPTTSANTLTYNAGKIGQCGTGRIAWHLSEEILNNTWSVAMWVKPTSPGVNNNILFCKNSTKSTDCQIYFSIISTTQLNLGVNGPSSSISKTGLTFSANTWYHVAATYDGSTAILYLNGTEVQRGTVTTAMPTGRLNMNINGRSTNAANTSVTGDFTSSYNDFRLYDHCLSAVEVKEISQGLVLHYKLDDIYAETTTNLYSGTFSNTCYNGATSKYGYGTTTDMYKTTGNFQGKESVKIYMGTAGLSAYPYVYFDAFNTTGTAVHTLSFDYYPTLQTSIIPYSYNGSYNISYITSNGAHDSKTNVSSVTIPVITNQWNHIAITMQKYDTTNTSRGNGYIRIGSASHTSTTTDYWLFANIQVEAKDHETGYASPGTTRSNVQIQDSSGYGHNGSITGTITVENDTPRYSASTYVNGSSYILTPAGSFAWNDLTQLTFSAWMKPTASMTGWRGSVGIAADSNQTARGIAITDYGNEFRGTYTNGSTYNTIATGKTLTQNEWHHCAGTLNGTEFKLYFDGALVKTQTIDWGTATLNSGARFEVGVDLPGSDEKFTGNYSDVRYYCTALSAADVKQLYELGAKIDNQNNIHTFELQENNNDKITKTGITQGSQFSECLNMSFLKYDPNIYIEPDGSCWVRVYHHNNPGAGSFASTNDFTHSVYIDENRWFNVELANHLDKWEIMIKGKFTATSDEWKLRWIQQYNPMTATYANVAVANITKITTNGYSASPSSWGGLYCKNSSAYLTTNNGNSGNWWGAVGSFSVYQNGIPGWGPTGTVTTTGFNDMYLRIDNVTFIPSTAKNTKNKIWTSAEFIEL